jgi:uncharacterized protein YjbJ (UPF0337 family)
MNAILVRGRINQARGEFRYRLCRMTGNRRGRVAGGMLRLMGGMQVKYGRARATVGRRFRKLTGH